MDVNMIMTRSERDELSKVVRPRAKVTKPSLEPWPPIVQPEPHGEQSTVSVLGVQFANLEDCQLAFDSVTHSRHGWRDAEER